MSSFHRYGYACHPSSAFTRTRVSSHRIAFGVARASAGNPNDFRSTVPVGKSKMPPASYVAVFPGGTNTARDLIA
jgi:hypothetical protein